MDQTTPPQPAQHTLPTMYDLPSEDPEESGLPDLFHLTQPRLLDETCRPLTDPPTPVLTASDLNLYYDPNHPRWYKRPDWFMVLGKSPAQTQSEMHLSYVIWQEGTVPFIVIELLSPGTEAEDLGQTLREINTPPTKWQVYEQILRIPYYATFDRYQNQFQLWRLVATRYEVVDLPKQRIWFEELTLGLGVWQGAYQGTIGLWLRWYDQSQNWISTSTEQLQLECQRADHERQRADQERQRADQERQRADQLAAKLRELGIDSL